MQNNLGEQQLRIAYILHRFPHLTETFVMREMNAMLKQGVEINIFSLLSPEHSIVHEQARELLPCTHYSPFLSWEVLKAQFYFLRRSPARYFRALTTHIGHTWREPMVFLRALAIFPKSVYFARQIEALKVDHIHAHFVWLGALAASVAAALIDVTFTIHPHAFDLFWRNQQDIRSQLENATKITTISSYNAIHIASLCRNIRLEDVEIVHLGVDTDYFKPRISIADSKPVQILSIGRLIQKKGHEYLIEACRLLAERGTNFQCQIVGDGPRQHELQALIERHHLQNCVTLLGAIGQTDILDLYQKSHVFALPCVTSKTGDQDGMPYVLIEAMSCEIPVVTTPLSGIPELVHDGETGFLVKERDISGLADALEKLIVNEALRRQLGRQARQVVIQDFQSQTNTVKLITLFRQISCKPETVSL